MSELQVTEYIAYVLAALVIARVVVAPYFVWRDDQEKILIQSGQIDLLSSKRKHTIEERVTGLQLDMAEAAGVLLSTTNQFVNSFPSSPEPKRTEMFETWRNAFGAMKSLGDALLSDDVTFRECQDLLNLAGTVVHEVQDGQLLPREEYHQLHAGVQSFQQRLRGT